MLTLPLRFPEWPPTLRLPDRFPHHATPERTERCTSGASLPAHVSTSTVLLFSRLSIPPPSICADLQRSGIVSIALYELMTCFTLRLCSHLPRRVEPTPISSVTTIIDFADVSLPLLWSLRSHLQEASTLATANYPETLSTIVVVNTPSFFPTVWGWIKVRVRP